MASDRHILFVEMGTGFGGSTRCLVSLVEMCAERGWRVSVALGYPVPELERWGDSCVVLPLYDRWAYRLGQHVRAAGASQSRGRFRSAATFIASGLTGDLPLALSLARYCRQHRVDLIHANNELLVNRTALLAGRLAALPVISHQRGWAWQSRTTRWLAGQATRVVAISDFVVRSLLEAGVGGERVRRVYDGVDCSPFAHAAEQRQESRLHFGFGPQDDVIGLPAVLLPWKGQGMFLEAFAQVAQRHEGARALLVGASPSTVQDLAPSIERQISELGLGDRVRMVGHVDDMASAYAAMDVVVHASQRPEPFGLVVVEAMAAGKAVVAADTGGPAEVIEHGTSGWLYRMGDANSLAASLRRLLDDVALRSELEHHAPQRARLFSQEANWREIAYLYDEITTCSANAHGAARSAWERAASFSLRGRSRETNATFHENVRAD